MRWTKIEEIYGETLKKAYGFNNPETSQSYWEALHKSVTEHVSLKLIISNIIIIIFFLC